jgi:replicative DNA helicase
MAAVSEYSDPILERNTLAALLCDEVAAIQYFPQLLPEYFTDSNLRRVFTIARRFVMQSGAAPSREAIRVELNTLFPRESDGVAANTLALCDQLLGLPHTAPVHFLVSKLVNFARARSVLVSAERVVQLFSEGRLEEGIKQYEESALTLQATDIEATVSRGDVIEDFEKRKSLVLDMEAHPDKYRGVLTGIDQLDSVTGGLWKGELGFVFGRTGSGKSFFLLEMAYNAFLAGLRVLVIPIEMPLIQWERRFDARISHITYESFKWARLTVKEKDQWERRILQVKQQFSTQGAAVFITHIPMSCTLGAVRVELERLIRRGTPADLLVIDYADLLSPPRSLYSEQGELTAIFRELKGMAGAYRIPVWTATQSRREAYGKERLDMSDVGYAMGKVHVSDLVVGISRSDADQLSNRVILNIVKYRDGVYSKPIFLKSNFALGMINDVL